VARAIVVALGYPLQLARLQAFLAIRIDLAGQLAVRAVERIVRLLVHLVQAIQAVEILLRLVASRVRLRGARRAHQYRQHPTLHHPSFVSGLLIMASNERAAMRIGIRIDPSARAAFAHD